MKKSHYVLTLHIVNKFIDNELGYSICQLTFHYYAKFETLTFIPISTFFQNADIVFKNNPFHYFHPNTIMKGFNDHTQGPRIIHSHIQSKNRSFQFLFSAKYHYSIISMKYLYFIDYIIIINYHYHMYLLYLSLYHYLSILLAYI